MYYNGRTTYDEHPWSSTPVYVVLGETPDKKSNYIQRTGDNFFLTTSNKPNSLSYQYMPRDGHQIDFASFPNDEETYMLIHNRPQGKDGNQQLLFADKQMTRRMYDRHHNQNRVYKKGAFNITRGDINISVDNRVIKQFKNKGCTAVEWDYTETIQVITSNEHSKSHEVEKTIEVGYENELTGWTFKGSLSTTDAVSWSQSLSRMHEQSIAYKMSIPLCSEGHILGDWVTSSNHVLLDDFIQEVTGFSFERLKRSECPHCTDESFADVLDTSVQPLPKDRKTVLMPKYLEK